MSTQEMPRIVVLEFWNAPKRVGDEFQNEHWVRYAPAHSVQNTQTEDAVRRLKPTHKVLESRNSAKATHMQYVWDQIEPKYLAWLKGEELPEEGTPLTVFTSINKESLKVFKSNGIHTVEALAEMTDPQCDKIPLPNVRQTRKMATKFLEGLQTADAAEREMKRDAEMAAMKEKLDAAMALLEEKAAKEDSNSIVDELRAECDAKGIKYHHKSGETLLRQLLSEHQNNSEAA